MGRGSERAYVGLRAGSTRGPARRDHFLDDSPCAFAGARYYLPMSNAVTSTEIRNAVQTVAVEGLAYISNVFFALASENYTGTIEALKVRIWELALAGELSLATDDMMYSRGDADALEAAELSEVRGRHMIRA